MISSAPTPPIPEPIIHRPPSYTIRTNRLSRRQFLRTTAVAAGALQIARSGVIGAAGQPGANSQFIVGHIGTGGMGGTHLNNMLRFEKGGKVKIAAVCDCDDNRLEAAWENTKRQATPYRDYRYLLGRKDLDAEVRDDARCTLTRIPGPKSLDALKKAFATAPEDFKFALADSLRARGETIASHPTKKLFPTRQTTVGQSAAK